MSPIVDPRKDPRRSETSQIDRGEVEKLKHRTMKGRTTKVESTYLEEIEGPCMVLERREGDLTRGGHRRTE